MVSTWVSATHVGRHKWSSQQLTSPVLAIVGSWAVIQRVECLSLCVPTFQIILIIYLFFTKRLRDLSLWVLTLR